MQRPFVWKTSQIRDLMDSLYRGYPVGHLISWKSEDITLKDGKTSKGEKILIDGQQRMTAIKAAILGERVVNKDYGLQSIKISFHPIHEKFEVQNPAFERDHSWLSDIGPIIRHPERLFSIVKDYHKQNPNSDPKKSEITIQNLVGMRNKMFGLITLDSNLDLEKVNEIFIRVNSKGTRLNQSDFIMSKIATYAKNGSNLRKYIDYFCHLLVKPDFYTKLEEPIDEEFFRSGYLENIKWVKNNHSDLYKLTYDDLLKVAFTSEFDRGKMADLVSLLSGRDFKTRKNREDIREETFKRLEKSLLRATKESNFKDFLLIIKSTGFVDPGMIKGKNSLNFSYIVYLKLREMGVPKNDIESFVRRWFVMSILTSRYSVAVETMFESDIKEIKNDHEKYLRTLNETKLSHAFWNLELISEFEKSGPPINVFLASQIKEGNVGFLSKNVLISDLERIRGERHHIFPKAYVEHMYDNKIYDQAANIAYTQTEINRAIGDKSPSKYFAIILKQCEDKSKQIGNIIDIDDLKKNLQQHCVPESVFNMTVEHFVEFLTQRRKLMAKKVENFYKTL